MAQGDPEDREGGGRRGGFPLFRIAGIQIRIDPSWFVIFLLVLWSLSAGYLPREYPGLEGTSYWIAGLVATALFFLSILLHELAHSLVARRAGIPVPEITLFLFGGVSRMHEEPKQPGLEFRVAIVGPLASFALAVLFYGASRLLVGPVPDLGVTILEYLALINVALGVFNLIPGFPLDGGRVLRAILWRTTGSLRRATRIASDAGKGFAFGLMALGALSLFQGALLGGLWLIFIGMFLRSMASTGYEELLLRTSLEGLDVADAMIREVVHVPPDLTLEQLVHERFLQDGYRGYPVVDGGRVVGLVTVDEVRKIPPERFAQTTVADVMRPLDAALLIEPEATATQALRRMAREGLKRLIVTRDGRLEGLLTQGTLERHYRVRRLFAEDAPEAS